MNNSQFSLNVFLCHILKENQGKKKKKLPSHLCVPGLSVLLENVYELSWAVLAANTPATTGEGCSHSTNTGTSGLNQEKRKLHLLLQESGDTFDLCAECAPLLEPTTAFTNLLHFPPPTQCVHP